jgi:exodeoxyribonuclease VII large subunit
MLLHDSPGAQMPAQIWSVTAINTRAKEMLERGLGSITVAGEISNYRHDRSGHRYFSLKDPGGVLPAALFRQRAMGLAFEPKDGMQVLAKGVITVYGPSGRYQMMVTQLMAQGEGALKAAYEALRAKLSQEGLFDAARKRPLPLLPRRIAVVTSPTGSVWRDIQEVSRRRFAHAPLLLVPTRTQGADCAPEVVKALDHVALHAAALGIDVVIVARGGGSLEDLWGFNDERVARAIARCPVPVVSAIGHETDFTIADDVADVRAPTPSAAAERVVPMRLELQSRIARLWARSAQAQAKLLRHERLRLRAATAQLGDGRRSLWAPTQRLAQVEHKISQQMHRLLGQQRLRFGRLCGRFALLHPKLRLARHKEAQARTLVAMAHGLTTLLHKRRHALAVSVPNPKHMQHRLAVARARLQAATVRLQALSPLAVLERGYSIVRTPEGQVVRSHQEVAQGAKLLVRLHHGELDVQVAEARAPNP